jgi:uracil-DNA glycosylase family 4
LPPRASRFPFLAALCRALRVSETQALGRWSRVNGLRSESTVKGLNSQVYGLKSRVDCLVAVSGFLLCALALRLYSAGMSDGYDQLLAATIDHLEGLRARGVRYLPVAPETLRSLAATPPSPVSQRATEVPREPAVSAAPIAVSAPRPSTPALTPAVRGVPVAPVSAAASVVDDLLSAMPPALSGDAKTAAFSALRQRVMSCVKCAHLAAARKNVVFGVGSIDADLMFVGEAPGADEDSQGEPFVGKAGQLLTRIIQTMGLSRQTVYIGNVLKCRPDTPDQPFGNRKPTSDEMKVCFPYLQEQIALIRPKVLVALGATAMEGLLGKPIFITKIRGQWQSFRGIPLMPTYHPAYLLRNQNPIEKRRVWEDMLQVMEKLQMPISEKQRGFFRQVAGG